MGVATVPGQEQEAPEAETEVQETPEAIAEEGAPTPDGAEATRSAAHIFQYSAFVHVGTGAAECEQRETGRCRDAEHFHAWLCMPNALQGRDIEEKARAAKARRMRAFSDPTTDAAVMLEAQLDELLRGDREALVHTVAEREVRKRISKTIDELRNEEEWKNYGQDKEEYERLQAIPEEERSAEEFQLLEDRMGEFASAVEKAIAVVREQQITLLNDMDDDTLRKHIRDWQAETDSQLSYFNTLYMWLGFISTRRVGSRSKRVYETIEEFRNAPPEVIEAVEDEVRELEGRLIRGDASGN